MTSNQYQAEQKDNVFNVQRILLKILSKWYLLLLSLIICLGVAYFIDRYTKPTYYISSLLLIKPAATDKTNVSNILYEDGAYNITGSLSNEIIFLKSQSLIEKSIKDLDFQVSYYKKGQFVVSELYKSSPIQVELDTTSTFIPYYTDISCIIKSPNYYLLYTEDQNLAELNNKMFKFGQSINIKGFKFLINLKFLESSLNQEIIFQLNSLEGLTKYYKNTLLINPVVKESSVLKLSLEGNTPNKEIDFLNQLSVNLIESNLKEKNTIASKTVSFINQMLSQSKDSLATIENKLERFKGSNSVVSVQEKGSKLMEDIKRLESEKVALLSANQYFNYLEKSLQQNEEGQMVVVPSSLGVQDINLNTSVAEIVSLQLENQILKADKKIKNPYIESNNQRIEGLKRNVIERIKSLKSINEITLRDINRQINQYVAAQQKLPAAERELNDISRNYIISEGLVQFLMEKQAEADITRASNNPDYKIVDVARIERGPVKNLVFDYKMAILAGLVIPIAFILLADILNNKINSREDLIRLTPLPLLGIVVHDNTQKKRIDGNSLKTALSESLRSIRSNLSYISESNGCSKVIVLTSSISGEGKSFCAYHLGHILAISNKKTLLINADMRKKGNYENELGNEKSVGLSNYLSGMAPLTSIIQKTKIDDLFIVNSGDLPPNPSELLLSSRMRQLLEELKYEFNYILLDTPPIGIISDGLELMKQADINIIVTRQGYTKKTFLSYINELYLNQKYPNMVVVFNDVILNSSAYGYGTAGYGYGYYRDNKEKKAWFHKLVGMIA